jgi:hypothetical protein
VDANYALAREKFGFQRVEPVVLGRGEYGVVFEIDERRVLKITTSLEEWRMHEASSQIPELARAMPFIYDRCVLRSEPYGVYAIVRETVRPIPPCTLYHDFHYEIERVTEIAHRMGRKPADMSKMLICPIDDESLLLKLEWGLNDHIQYVAHLLSETLRKMIKHQDHPLWKTPIQAILACYKKNLFLCDTCHNLGLDRYGDVVIYDGLLFTI